MLIAVFETENNAYEGLSALKELHSNSDITLYATAVVSKNEKGEFHLNTAAEQGPIGTATGLFAGSLLGLLGGPLGLLVGATTGSIAGLIYDANANDINTTFVDEVSNALSNGKTAVIAEIDESWTVPVDTKLEGLNAIVFRRLKYEVADEQMERESKAIDAELSDLKAELKEAKEEDKARIKSAIAKLKYKAKATNELVIKNMNESKNQFDAKVNTMEEQMKNAGDRRKARLEKRIHDLKEEHQLRRKKLKQASKLMSEALGPKEELQ